VLLAEGPGVAVGKNLKKIDFLAYDTGGGALMCVHKTFQPNRFSRLAGYTQYMYECHVLFYTEGVPGNMTVCE